MFTNSRQTSPRKVSLVAYTGLLWYIAVALPAIAGTFEQPPGVASIPLYLAVSAPLLLVVAGYLLWGRFRRFVQSLIGDPWGIVALQCYRVLGLVFVVLASRNELPAVFALPAGWGDFFIGISAPLVALLWSGGRRSGKVVFVLWNVLGMLDLLMAVSLGILAATIQPGAITMAPIRVFPLSLIPTFAVPLSFMLHLAALAQFWFLSGNSKKESKGQLSQQAALI